MKKFFLFVALLVGTLAQAQISFQPVSGVDSGMDAALAAWVSNRTNEWLWGVTRCKVDQDAYDDIIISDHRQAGSLVFRNTMPQTGQVTFEDITLSLIGDYNLMPGADKKPHCRDFDNDGKEDVGGFRNESQNSAVLFNNYPSGWLRREARFHPSASVSANFPDYLKQPGFMDINGDGYLDARDVRVTRNRFNNGTLGFDYLYDPLARDFIKQPTAWILPLLPQEVTDYIAFVFNSTSGNAAPSIFYHDCCDFGGDSQKDMIVTGFVSYGGSAAPHFTRLLIKQGDGSFVDVTDARGLPLSGHVIWVGDLNVDGLLDLIVHRGSAPGVYLQQPGGLFAQLAHTDLNNTLGLTGSYATTAGVADFDGDGLPELLVHRPYAGALKVYRNNGTGFDAAPVLNLTGGFQTESYDVGDFNADSKLDVAFCKRPSSTPACTIYLNTSPLARAPIFLGEAVLAELRMKAANADPLWLEIKGRADEMLQEPVAPYSRTDSPANTINYGYQGSGWLTAVETLGLAYLLTEDPAYAAKVGEVLDVMSGTAFNGYLEPIAVDQGYATRNVPLAAAYGLSWVGSRLTPSQRANAVSAINLWFDWYLAAAPSVVFQKTGPAYGNYFGGHLLGFGAAAEATRGLNPRAEEIAAHVRGMFDSVVPEAFETGGFAGGYFVESGNYGTAQFAYLLQYMQLTQDERLQPYAAKMARSLIYNLKPNRWQLTDEGDYPGDFVGVLPRYYPLILAEILRGTSEGGWMRWLATNLGTPPGNATTAQQAKPLLRFIYDLPSQEAVDYRLTLPLAYCSPGDEHLYVRSDWSDDAVWTSFAGGSEIWASHQSKAAGHISLQKGNDYLLVNAGQWKGPTGVFGKPQVFSRASWRTNTLFFDSLGEYMLISAAYVGGQGQWGHNRLKSCVVGDGYAYAEADLTPAYFNETAGAEANRVVESFTRSLLVVGGKFLVVRDHVEALKPEYGKRLLWHFNAVADSAVTGNVIESRVRASAVRIEVLAPLSPTIQLLPDGVSGILDPVFLTKRAEISDSAPGTILDSLQVIRVE